MTEAEILEQIATHGDRIWSVIQYWSSVSFAILIAGHFAAERIHWSVLAWFGVLYAAFTLNFVNMVQFDISVIRAGLTQLQHMGDEGRQLGLMSQAFLLNAPSTNAATVRHALRLVFVGLFVTTLVYPAYCHYKRKKPFILQQ